MTSALESALVVLLLSTSAPGEVTIDIQAEASVSGTVVRLADLALVEGDSSGSLSTLVVCPSPLAGQSATVPVRRIRRRIVAALGSDTFTLTGAETCRVARAAGAARPVAERRAAGARTSASDRTLGALIRQYVADRLARTSGSMRVEFDTRDSDTLSVTDGAYQFRIISAANQLGAGRWAVRVEMVDPSRPGLVARTAQIRFNVVLLEDVVVAVRTVRAGGIISEADVRVERREFRQTPRLLLTSVGDVVGATARRDVEAGRVIQVEALQKTLMVRRGDAVTVVVYSRGFRVKTVSRALGGGELGSAVAVQGLDGRGKFYATVIGPRTVELRLCGASNAVPGAVTTAAAGDGRAMGGGR